MASVTNTKRAPSSVGERTRRSARASVVALALGCSPSPPDGVDRVAGDRPAKDAPPTARLRLGACRDALAGVASEHEPVARAMCAEIDEHDVVGAQIAIVQHDAVVLSWAIGRRCVDDDARMTARTRLRIGSVTKAITAASVLALADEGAIDLDAPLSNIAPALVDDAAIDPITIRQLLQHTAGLPEHRLAPHMLGLDPPDLARALVAAGPIATPGERFAYANTHYVVLGLVLDARIGSLRDAIDTRVLAGTDGGFAPRADDACGHLRDEARWRAYATADDLALFGFGAPFVAPAGGVIMSAEDLARTIARIAPRIVAEPTVPTAGAREEVYVMGLRGRPAHTRERTPIRVFTHTGHTGDFVAEVWWIPHAATSIAILVNGPHPLRATALMALAEIADVHLDP